MPINFTSDWSTTVLVMVWCCQKMSYYVSQWWPRFMLSHGVIKPQWFNTWAIKHDEATTWKRIFIWCTLVSNYHLIISSAITVKYCSWVILFRVKLNYAASAWITIHFLSKVLHSLMVIPQQNWNSSDLSCWWTLGFVVSFFHIRKKNLIDLQAFEQT